MALKDRVKRIEDQVNGVDKGYVLLDCEGKAVEAEVLSMPTHETEGLARLSDGVEVPIADKGTDGESGMVFSTFGKQKGRLYLRSGIVFVLVGVDLSAYPKQEPEKR